MQKTMTLSRLALAAAVGVLGACGGGTKSSPAPAPPAPVVLEILRRSPSGALTGVAGVEVHRSDAVTGAFVETKLTGASGKADFGVQAAPVTLTVTRPASGSVPRRAYTLLGLPPGSARMRLDRLPGEPASALATVQVALSPALPSTEGASACPASSCSGAVDPGGAWITGVAIAERDVQDDGLVTLVAETYDVEGGGITSCRVSADATVPSGLATVPAAASSVMPIDPTVAGALGLTRVLALRRGLVFPFGRGVLGGVRAGCARALTGATGFSVQGAAAGPGSSEEVPHFYVLKQTSERAGALWVSAPAFDASILRTLPSADAELSALSYGAKAVHATLKGGQVQSLAGARALVLWSPSGSIGNVNPALLTELVGLPADARAWFVHAGAQVKATSCDGTAANPDCALHLRLPELPGDFGFPAEPPDYDDGTLVQVEAVAPASAASGDAFWRLLAAEGDLEAVLARGYTSASRTLTARKLTYTLFADTGVNTGPTYELGRVTGPGGIDCGGPAHPYWTVSCQATLPGGNVTLVAQANAGAEFVQWNGRCAASAGSGASAVTFVLDADQTCWATFRPLPGPSPTLSVTEPQGAPGLITSTDGWISCGVNIQGIPQTSCFFTYSSGTAVVLNVARTSNPGTGYTIQWTGDCTGTGTSTVVTLSGNRSCGVTFTPVAP